MELEELTKKRRDHVQSCQDNKDHSHDVIADLYSNRSHFIYELLQSADDALASDVLFQLTTSQLKIIHNGKRKFTFKDVESITTVGSSTKPNEINSIGRFGAGFKSVFTITKTPRIHSGKYHFRIVNYIVPESIKAIPTNDQTIIILPFNNETFGSKEEICQKIAYELKEFSKESLLFLNNIRRIRWKTDQDFGYYSCSKNYAPDVSIIKDRINNNQEKSTEYLLFNGNGINSLTLSIAYLKQENNLYPIEKPLFVFFPTKENLRFKFLVHVPYKTTPNRETISYEDNENQQLTTQLAHLVAQSIVTLKEMGYVNVRFLSLLPIDKEISNPIYQVVFQEVQQLFNQYDLLPTTDSKFSRPQHCLLASSKKMVELLSPENINSLFNKNYWIDTEITYSKNLTRLLWTYLKECLKIKEISPHNFLSSITSHFLIQQSDEWIINFYVFLNQTPSYERSKAIYQPIIRLENNDHVKLYGNDNSPQVYFPKENSSRFQTVKRSILENKEAKIFLESLGIKEPDEIAEIKTFICPKYLEFPDARISEEEYLKDLDYVYQIWKNATPQKREEITNNLLEDSYFIGCFDNKKRFIFRKKENEDNYDYYSNEAKSIVYFESQELTSWFEGNTEDQYFFVSQEVGNKYKDLLRKFGIEHSIYLENLNPDQSQKYYNSYRKGVDGFSYRFKIHGLQHSLDHINFSRSLQIWSILLENTQKLKGKMEYKQTKKPEETWKSDNHEQLSLAMEQLTKHHWLFDNEGRLIELPLADISLMDLRQDYIFEHSKFDKLVKILELKSSDEIKFKKLEEKYEQIKKENAEKDKVIEEMERQRNQERLDFERKFAELQRQITELTQPNDDLDIVSDKSDEWIPEIHPDEVSILVSASVLEISQPRALTSPTLPSQVVKTEEYNFFSLTTNTSNQRPSKPKQTQDIGEWGERIARNYLNKKYPSQDYSVVWLNSNGDTGIGCDFQIFKNNQVIAYYEIKSTEDDKPSAVKITRAQWSLARNLYEEGRGDEYFILVVSNAKNNSPEIYKIISNPVQKWKSGELEAQPVEIIL